MTTKVDQEQPGKTVGKAEQPAIESAPQTFKKPADPLDEFRAQAEMAYAAYLKAQRKVATAYKEREQLFFPPSTL